MSLVATAALVATSIGVPAEAAPSNNNSEKLRAAVTLEGVRRHQAAMQTAADLAGGNRFAGLEGHQRSVDYVVEQLRAAGYQPQLHTFTYDAFFEVTPTRLTQVSPTPSTYVNGNDFRIMSYSGSGDVTAPLAAPSGSPTACASADFAGFPAGSIALVSRGTCTFRTKTDNAIAAGATAVLIANNIPGVLNGTLGATGLSAIPSLGLTQALGQSLRAQMSTGSVVMHVVSNTRSQPLDTMNVLAETALGDPDNVVMVGAHLDSVSAGPGINDNGSGSAAILETAIQMAKAETHNKVRFAWWSAEESGLVGATRYVTSLAESELSKIALYLNFDMIGSPNFVRFVYDGDNSGGFADGAVGPAGSAAIEQAFVEYFASQGLASDPTPFNGRSDYGPFIARGVPAGGLFTGAEGIKTAAQAAVYGGTAGVAFDPCYHAACDTFANNSDTGLHQMSDAVAHAVITFAQNTSSVNGKEGKGNFKPRPSGATGGSGTEGGGGGLHDEHHDEEM
ncbi:MAG TPA: M28 family metallopeptidase [Acidimicrobiales bacterium]|nr:M28 family metallopeptidase [Acidimicrobiales bacterium]